MPDNPAIVLGDQGNGQCFCTSQGINNVLFIAPAVGAPLESTASDLSNQSNVGRSLGPNQHVGGRLTHGVLLTHPGDARR